MDPPVHDGLRPLLTRDFMIKRVEALRPRVQDLVDGLIDGVLAGPQRGPTHLFR
jgi:cytochrome P450